MEHTSFLVLYRTEENRHGAMVISADSKESLAKTIDAELTAIMGKDKPYLWAFADMSKEKAHLFDVLAPN